MNKAIIAIVAIVVIAGGAAFAMLSGKSDNTSKKPASSTSGTTKPDTAANTQEPTNPPSNDTAAAANTITYDNSGFSPSTITVKSGDKLTIKNTSSHALQFDSDPHPEHTEDPEINVGLIAPGESQTITVTKSGSHGYHNHLSPGDTGTLIVE